MFKKFKTQPLDKLTVGVFCASGNVGRATIAALSYYFSSKINIKAIVRDPSKSQDLADFHAVSLVQGEVGSEACRDVLRGVSSIFVIPPAVENRIEKTIVTLKVAKECNVCHVVTISVTAVDNVDTQFGKEFLALETFVKTLGMTYTILRLPLFLDNFWIVKQSFPNIRLTLQQGKYFTPVVVADVGVAAAFVLSGYKQHLNKSYVLTSDRIRVEDLVGHLSEILERKFDYELLGEEEYGQFLMENGIEKWQIKGTTELSRLINEGSRSMDVENNADFRDITGQNPTNVKDWIMHAKEFFLE